MHPIQIHASRKIQMANQYTCEMENKVDFTEGIPETCASCGAKLKGEYCRKCGEKRIIPARDFSIAKFLTQTLGHAVHFDTKLGRSLWFLFVKPGFLTAEWIAGRRVRYMKPLQLFVLAGILFYFFLPSVPAHFSHCRDLVRGFETQNIVLNTFRYDAGQALTEMAGSGRIGMDDLTKEIDKAAGQRSKTWLFLIIPFWGAMVYLFFRNKIPWLVPHFIFAVHGLILYILTDLLIHFFMAALGLPPIGKDMMLLLLLVFFPYLVLAARRVYDTSWAMTVVKVIGLEAGLLIFLIFYRQLMTIWTIVVHSS